MVPGLTGGTLPDWLKYIQQIHFRSIDMTLDRVALVLERLGLGQPTVPVIAVSGTNGKGSTVAMLESIYRAAGYAPGAYTSPHLQVFNERIRVDGKAVSDAVICDAFEQINVVRGAIPLTYFEFGTLAALLIFADRQATPLLLEVGMGGRLDAVNVIAADVAIVTSIGLDHQAWLGEDREAIGWEKAGIFRAGKPAICGDPAPPSSIGGAAAQAGAKLFLLGRDFQLQKNPQDYWHWRSQHVSFAIDFPIPRISGARQWQNAAAALMAIFVLQQR
ncbi:MAG TPA: bifunctional folylpolyglutamate synthase/dihydrofolate synthase, partial [Gammaproteobacteria bacterium]|nr:bifunctional folylpolyglutamate synthase/dihydrofolate synthase [Gammaproteobacteria bacterium]